MSWIGTDILSVLQFSGRGGSRINNSQVNYTDISIIFMAVIYTELAAFIVAQLMKFRVRLRGSDDADKKLVSRPNALVVWLESAGVIAAVGVAYLITSVTNNPLSELFLVLLGQVTVSYDV